MIEDIELSPEEKLLFTTFGRGINLYHISPEGKQAVHDILAQLEASFASCPLGFKGRHRAVELIRLRFGFIPRTTKERARCPYQNSDSRTLEEVAKYFNITRERVRQIETYTLRCLRHPSRASILKEYLHPFLAQPNHPPEANDSAEHGIKT